MKHLNRAALSRRIEERVALDLAEGRISSAAISVLQDGEEIFCGHFGRQSPAEDAPLRKDALFRLASMTKPITAAAILLLRDRGLVSLDEPVCSYLPAFATLCVASEDGGSEPLTVKPTLRHLLSHTSGCVDATAKTTATMTEQERKEPLAFANFFARLPFVFAPGARQAYSAVTGFSILTAVAMQVTGMDFADLLQREIFSPCGMTDTTFAPTAEQWARTVGMHDILDGQAVLGKTTEGCVFYEEPTSLRLGGAGLVASLSDYCRFAEMLRRGGVTENGQRILSAEAVREMRSPQSPHPLDGHDTRWGLGVRVITKESHPRLPVGCFGWSGAYGAHFWIDPENEITAVYLKNSHKDGGSEAITGKHFEEDVYAD